MQIGLNIKDDILEIKALATEESADIILNEAQINQIITLYKTHGHPIVDHNTVISFVCSVFHIELEDFFSKSRKRDNVVARQCAMYILHRLDVGTYSRIGILVGNKDHATVLYGCRCIEDMIKYKDVFYLNKIIRVLKNYDLI